MGCFAAAAAQLPPEILVDRYLLRADRLMEAKDPKGALEMMGKIVALQKEHGLTLPEEFHFKYAKVVLSAGLVQDAIDAMNTYLLEAGREGKFYREALELLDEAERLQAKTEKIRATADKYLATMDRVMEGKNYLITHKFQPQLTGDRATEESAQRHERVEEPDQRVGSGG